MPRFSSVFDDQFCGFPAVSPDDLRIVAIQTGDFEMPYLHDCLGHRELLSMVANAAFTRSWPS